MLQEANWPVGVGNVEEVSGKGARVEPENLKHIPLQLLVGAKDTSEVQEGISKWLTEVMKERVANNQPASHESARLRDTKRGRIGVLQDLQQNWSKHGIKSRFDIVEGAAHEFLKIQPTVIEWLKGVIVDMDQQSP